MHFYTKVQWVGLCLAINLAYLTMLQKKWVTLYTIPLISEVQPSYTIFVMYYIVIDSRGRGWGKSGRGSHFEEQYIPIRALETSYIHRALSIYPRVVPLLMLCSSRLTELSGSPQPTDVDAKVKVCPTHRVRISLFRLPLTPHCDGFQLFMYISQIHDFSLQLKKKR